jgi:hypothetical protein
VHLRPFSQAALECLPPRDWVAAAALAASVEVPARRDLRASHLVCSVDPPGCQDIDDALSARCVRCQRLVLPRWTLVLTVHCHHRCCCPALDPGGCPTATSSWACTSPTCRTLWPMTPRWTWRRGAVDASAAARSPRFPLLVRHRSAVLLCRRARGTTVYLVDRRLDMLPARLSSNLCSLRSREWATVCRCECRRRR